MQNPSSSLPNLLATRWSFDSTAFYLTCAWLLGVAAFIAYLSYQAIVLGSNAIEQENNIAENAQSLFLCIASALLFIKAYQAQKPWRLFFLFFAGLAFAFIFREIDVETFDLPEVIIFFGSGKGRNAMYAVYFLTLIYLFCRDFKINFSFGLKLWNTPFGHLLTAVAVMLVFGTIAEESKSLPRNMLWEELFELAGYGLFVGASLIAFTRGKAH